MNTQDGLKQFNRMPYGMSSGPAIFRRKLSSELRHIKMTVVNIVDILVSGKDKAEHLDNLSKVFAKLTLSLTLKTAKCNFFQPNIEYVGFMLNAHGIQTNPAKIEAVINAPASTSVNELQSFLGTELLRKIHSSHVYNHDSVIPVAEKERNLEVGRTGEKFV